MHTTIHIPSRGLLRNNNDKTPYELWKCRLAILNYFKVFGRKCYIKRNEDNLGKFDPKTDEGIFLGYSLDNKAYRCYNLILYNIVMSANVKVDDEKSHKST